MNSLPPVESPAEGKHPRQDRSSENALLFYQAIGVDFTVPPNELSEAEQESLIAALMRALEGRGNKWGILNLLARTDFEHPRLAAELLRHVRAAPALDELRSELRFYYAVMSRQRDRVAGKYLLSELEGMPASSDQVFLDELLDAVERYCAKSQDADLAQAFCAELESKAAFTHLPDLAIFRCLYRVGGQSRIAGLQKQLGFWEGSVRDRRIRYLSSAFLAYDETFAWTVAARANDQARNLGLVALAQSMPDNVADAVRSSIRRDIEAWRIVVLDALRHDSPPLRYGAAEALRAKPMIANERILEFLQRTAQGDAVEPVRKAANGALKAIAQFGKKEDHDQE